MPIYEYRCEHGHDFEAFQAMADDALDTCEVCGAAATRRLSAPAIHYKGSGFYTTDYARKGAKKPVESGSGAEGGSKSNSGSGEAGSNSGSGEGGSNSGSGSGDAGSKSSSGDSAKAGSSSSSSGSKQS